ncbi:MAG: outer membrane protein transport protein [Myxococcota bacterium]
MTVISVSVPTPVFAGGYEHGAAGTRALGRGGAFAARADDAMALFYNPANLANLYGRQLALNTNLTLYNACHSRTGTYTSDGRVNSADTVAGEPTTRFGAATDGLPNGYGRAELQEVCNSGRVNVVPELAFTWRVSEKLGVGLGILAPPAVGSTQFGNSDLVVDYDQHQVGQLPSPSRYQLLSSELLIFYPTVGAGYRIHPRFSVGASFGWGVGIFDYSMMSVALGSEVFGQDIRTRLNATDAFIPRFMVSAHAIPYDNLDVMVSFLWQDDVNADGDLTFTPRYYQANPGDRIENCDDIDLGLIPPFPPCKKNIGGNTLHAPQPWQLAFGVRYSDRIAPRTQDPRGVVAGAPGIQDSMATERFDVELNVVYERNSLVDDFIIDVADDATIPLLDLATSLPDVAAVPHRWRDQVSLRLGGDYNVVPGFAAVRAGFSFETNGVSDGYNTLDFMPHQRYGLHTGGTLRFGKLDLSIAYAFLRNKTMRVSQEDARIEQVVAEGNDSTTREEAVAFAESGAGTVVNSGTYSSHFHVLSFAVNYNFQ